MKDKRDFSKLRDMPLSNEGGYKVRFVEKMWCQELSPINLTVPMDNGKWTVVKVLKRDKAGKPLQWLGRWKSNEKKLVNGKH